MSAFDFYVGLVTIWAVTATMLAARYAKVASDALQWNTRFYEVARLRRAVRPEPIRQRFMRYECWN